MSQSQKSEDFLYEEIIPTKSKLAFGGTLFANLILSGIALGPITFFYNVKLGLSGYLISLAWLIFISWNTINDPLFGFIEDRTKSEKYGRRIPYLRFGAPIYTLLFIICWFPLVDLNDQWALFLNFLIVLFLFDTLYTIVGLITYSLPAEMAITSKARSSLMVYGAIFSCLGLLFSFVIPIMLLTGTASPELNPAFQPAMIIVGIVCGLILFLSSFYIKENQYTQMEEPLGLIESIKETFKNKSFLVFEVSNFSFLLAQTILMTAIFYYVDYVLSLSGLLSIIPILLLFIMIIVFIPVYGKVLQKYELKRIFIYNLIIIGFSFILFFSLVGFL